MKTPKTFDAVAKSRRWKEAVARQTASMTREELLTFFNKDRTLAASDESGDAGKQTCAIREDSPTC